MLTCLHNVPKDTELTIGIDNAALIYAIEQCTYQTFWKDIDEHDHEALLEQIIMTLHKRTAKTTIVKVKAHQGQTLNEQADALAKAGTTEEAQTPPIQIPHSALQKLEMQVQPWDKDTEQIKDMQAAIREATTTHKDSRVYGMILSSPTITQQIKDKKVGRNIKAECMISSNLPRQVVRDQIMWATARTPCAAWTARWQQKGDNNAAATACPLCKDPLENVAHIQTSCKTLHNAITKAHDTCWYHIWTVMLPELQEMGYETYFETKLGAIPNFPYVLSEEMQPRKPDATLVYRVSKPTKRTRTSTNTNNTLNARKTGKVIFLDFARTTGNTQQRLTTARERKYDRQYKELVDQLNGQGMKDWSTHCYILNASYAAAIDISYWTDTLLTIGIKKTTINRVFRTAMTQLCITYSDIIQTRKVALASEPADAVRPHSQNEAGVSL